MNVVAASAACSSRATNIGGETTGSSSFRSATAGATPFFKPPPHLRKAAEHTILRLSRRIGRVVSDFRPQECRNFFRHAGYART